MAAKVRIPAPLRKLTKDQAIVEVEGKTIDELIASLEKSYPGLKERVCDESGQIRRFINVFVNGEDIRFKDGAKTVVADGAEVSIIPAIAGGVAPLARRLSLERCEEGAGGVFGPLDRRPSSKSPAGTGSLQASFTQGRP